MIFNIVFMGLSIPVGFVAMWSVDKFGLRTGVFSFLILIFMKKTGTLKEEGPKIT
jgi:hypothetical protein